MTEALRGRSLFFIRMLKGLPGKHGDCNMAIASVEAAGTMNSIEHEPRLGALIWFKNDYHGDVGMYLNDGQMLVLDQGTPRIVACNEDMLKRDNPRGECVGWSIDY